MTFNAALRALSFFALALLVGVVAVAQADPITLSPGSRPRSLVAARGVDCDLVVRPGPNVLQPAIDQMSKPTNNNFVKVPTICLEDGYYFNNRQILIGNGSTTTAPTKLPVFIRALHRRIHSPSTPVMGGVIIDCTGMPNATNTACITFQGIGYGGGLKDVLLLGDETKPGLMGIQLISWAEALIENNEIMYFGAAGIATTTLSSCSAGCAAFAGYYGSFNNVIYGNTIVMPLTHAGAYGIALGYNGRLSEDEKVFKNNIAAITNANCALYLGYAHQSFINETVIAGASQNSICFDYGNGGNANFPSTNYIRGVVTDNSNGSWANAVKETGTYIGGTTYPRNVLGDYGYMYNSTQLADPCATAVVFQHVELADCRAGRYYDVLALGVIGASATIDISKAPVQTLTSTASTNMTLTPSAAGKAGQQLKLIITSDATGGDVITFASTFLPNGTLTITASKIYVVEFLSNGTNWLEVARSAGL